MSTKCKIDSCFFKCNLELLELTPRTFNALDNYGIKTIKEFMLLEKDKLCGISGIGNFSIIEISEKQQEVVKWFSAAPAAYISGKKINLSDGIEVLNLGKKEIKILLENKINNIYKFIISDNDEYKILVGIEESTVNKLLAIKEKLLRDCPLFKKIYAIRSTVINKLNLSVRSFNLLNNANIKSIYQLIKLTDADIKSFPACGANSLNELTHIRDEIINNDFTAQRVLVVEAISNIHPKNNSILVKDLFDIKTVQLLTSVGISRLGEFYKLKNDLKALRKIDKNIIVAELKKFNISLRDVIYDSLLLAIKKPKMDGTPRDDWQRDFDILQQRANDCSLQTAGEKYGLTRERIRQLENKVINKFRESFLEGHYEIYLKLFFRYSNYMFGSEFGFILGDLSNILKFFLKNELVDNIKYYKDYDIFVMGDDWVKDYKVLQDNLQEFIPSVQVDSILLDMKDKLSSQGHCVDVIDLRKLFFSIYEEQDGLCSFRKVTNLVRYRFILERFFPDGINLNDINELNLFKKYLNAQFPNSSFPDNDRSLSVAITSITTLIDRGVWKINADIKIDDVMAKKINKYIDGFKLPTVPVKTIFEEFKEDLIERGIDNKYKFHSVLRNIINQDYRESRDYIFKELNQTFTELIENFIKNSKILVTKEVLQENLPGFEISMMQGVIATTSIVNMNGYYVSIDNLDITNEDIDNFNEELDDIVSDENIHNARNIFYHFKNKFNGVFNRVGINDYLQLYNILNKFFGDKFEFSRPFIAKLGITILDQEVRAVDEVLKYGTVKINELRNIVNRVGFAMPSIIDFVIENNDKILFLDQQTISSVALANLDDEKFLNIDAVIEPLLAQDGYMYLDEIVQRKLFETLIHIDNKWFLYSIITMYSTNYKVFKTSNKLDDADLILAKENFDISSIDNKLKTITNIEVNYDDLLDYEDLM